MKPTTYNKKSTILVPVILSVLLGLQAFSSYGNNSYTHPTSISDKNLLCSTCQNLSPLTPAEATFEESSDDAVSLLDVSFLAPETPAEASFADDITINASSLIYQAAGLPVETDNNYSVNDLFWDLSFLAPVAPGEADFE